MVEKRDEKKDIKEFLHINIIDVQPHVIYLEQTKNDHKTKQGELRHKVEQLQRDLSTTIVERQRLQTEIAKRDQMVRVPPIVQRNNIFIRE